MSLKVQNLFLDLRKCVLAVLVIDEDKLHKCLSNPGKNLFGGNMAERKRTIYNTICVMAEIEFLFIICKIYKKEKTRHFNQCSFLNRLFYNVPNNNLNLG